MLRWPVRFYILYARFTVSRMLRHRWASDTTQSITTPRIRQIFYQYIIAILSFIYNINKYARK